MTRGTSSSLPWSLTSFRPVLVLRAHTASILTVAVLGLDAFVTHGRDNKIHLFSLVGFEAAIDKTPSIASPSLLTPTCSIDINALGYCKLSLIQLPQAGQALIAVPSVLHDELVDVFHLPSGKRPFRSIGKDAFSSKTGTTMAVSAFIGEDARLRVVASYEDGRVALFELEREVKDWSEGFPGESEGWVKVFEEKQHREPTMSLALEAGLKHAWSVGADHMVVKYLLGTEVSEQERSRAYKTAYSGRAGIAVRDDGRILAIAGWDGHVRIHSAKTFKPLALLEYHRDSVYAVAFSSVTSSGLGNGQLTPEDDSLPDEPSGLSGGPRRAWLAAGGKDERISLWELYPPARGG